MIKKAIIFLNGELNINSSFYKEIDYESYDIYCADGGSNHSYNLGLTPKLILGDLDSASIEVIEYYKKLGVKFMKFPTSKDLTDGELILDLVTSKYNEVLVLGGLGGRSDHFLTNLNLLEKYKNIVFEDENEILFNVDKNKKIEGQKGQTISLIPKTDIKGLTLKGFLYSIDNINISRRSSRCMSNIIEKESALIKYVEGSILGIIQK
ncbi:MAG: thiamine diphosphokinase [Psychrilyobacter sp.]|nr:thiamine diphosphokinase [Psychrilyobacter sp.]